MCVSHSLTFRLETKMPCHQTLSRKKKVVVFKNVTVNAYQGQLNAEFSKVCEIFCSMLKKFWKVCSLETLKYIWEFHTPVCCCGVISTPWNVMLNETNCDWLFDMSVKFWAAITPVFSVTCYHFNMLIWCSWNIFISLSMLKTIVLLNIFVRDCDTFSRIVGWKKKKKTWICPCWIKS